MLLCITSHSLAQQSTKGKDFWFSYMSLRQSITRKDYALPGPNWDYLTLQISAYKKTNVTVSIPNKGWSETISLAEHATRLIKMPHHLAVNFNSEEVTDIGIHVSSEDSISLSALVSITGASDATKILPTHVLGNDYKVMAFKGSVLMDHTSQLTVVATEDNTEVVIVPSTTTIRYNSPAGTPIRVILNKGQTYQVYAQKPHMDLTGTTIRVVNAPTNCAKPIAVFSGSMLTSVGLPGKTCVAEDHMWEQMIPVNLWGYTYYLAPFITPFTPYAFRDMYNIKIIAAENNTKVTLNNATVATLQAGQSIYKEGVVGTAIIKASAPIQVAQIMLGWECLKIDDYAKSGDPSMLIIPPVNSFTQEATFQVLTTDLIYHHYVNIIIKKSDIGKLYFKGSAVEAERFLPFLSDNDYVYCTVVIRFWAESNTISCSGGFLAYAYGYGKADSYAFNIDYNIRKEGFGPFPSQGYSFNIPGQVCSTEPISFKVNEESRYLDNYSWSFGDGTVSNEVSPKYAYPTAGTYTVEFIYELACKKDTVRKQLVVHPFIDLQLQQREIIICKGDTAVLSASGGTRYTWTPAPSLSDPFSSSPRAFPGTTTTYKLVAQNEWGCIDSTTVKVIVEDVVLSATSDVHQGYTPLEIKLNNQSIGAERYRWHMPFGEIVETDNPTYLLTEEGNFTFKLEAITASGCSYWDTVDVVTKDYFIPNVITPNGDDYNEYFSFNLLDTWELQIFNRWGTKVFQKQNYIDEFNAEGLPGGVYYYTLTNQKDGSMVKGLLTVIK